MGESDEQGSSSGAGGGGDTTSGDLHVWVGGPAVRLHHHELVDLLRPAAGAVGRTRQGGRVRLERCSVGLLVPPPPSSKLTRSCRRHTGARRPPKGPTWRGAAAAECLCELCQAAAGRSGVPGSDHGAGQGKGAMLEAHEASQQVGAGEAPPAGTAGSGGTGRRRHRQSMLRPLRGLPAALPIHRHRRNSIPAASQPLERACDSRPSNAPCNLRAPRAGSSGLPITLDRCVERQGDAREALRQRQGASKRFRPPPAARRPRLSKRGWCPSSILLLLIALRCLDAARVAC